MAQQKVKLKTLEAIKVSKIPSAKSIVVEKLEHKNTVIWNHRDSNSINVDTNYTDLNQPIPENQTNIG